MDDERLSIRRGFQCWILGCGVVVGNCLLRRAMILSVLVTGEQIRAMVLS
jgi:hypothetical protein